MIGAMTAEYLFWSLDLAMEEQMLNEIHVAAAWGRLVKIRHSISPGDIDHPGFLGLLERTQTLLERRTLSAREVSSIFQAVASISDRLPKMKELVPFLLDNTESLAAEMTPQALSNAAWSIGELCHPEGGPEVEGALKELGYHAANSMQEFSMQDVALLTWGFSVFGELRDKNLGQKVKQYVRRHVRRIPRSSVLIDVPMIAIALTRLGLQDEDTMLKLTVRLAPVLPRLRPWGLVATLWTWSQPWAEYMPTILDENAKLEVDSVYGSGHLRQKIQAPKWLRIHFRALVQNEALRRGVSDEHMEAVLGGPRALMKVIRNNSPEKSANDIALASSRKWKHAASRSTSSSFPPAAAQAEKRRWTDAEDEDDEEEESWGDSDWEEGNTFDERPFEWK
mmetsp:Transcript_74081/g.192374  ORF Transcript_74081/g.192374 Transcript_74081/m.192374 type:complete len:394 (-) Transcript_74081:36-1217(-)